MRRQSEGLFRFLRSPLPPSREMAKSQYEEQQRSLSDNGDIGT